MAKPKKRNPGGVGTVQMAVPASAAGAGATRRQASGTVEPSTTRTEASGPAIGSTITCVRDTARNEPARTTSDHGGMGGRRRDGSTDGSVGRDRPSAISPRADRISRPWVDVPGHRHP